MTAQRARNGRDLRPFVVLITGLAILVSWHTGWFAPSWHRQPRNTAERGLETIQIWLSSPNIEAGVYTVPRNIEVGALCERLGLVKPTQGGNLRLVQPVGVMIKDEAPAIVQRLPPRLCNLFFQPISVNEADSAALTTIPGIGPKLADEIVTLRATLGGHFQRLDELLAVRGIGPQKLTRFRDFLVLE